MKHKAGLYRFERSTDLFSVTTWSGDIIEIRLTEKEARAIFKDKLFQRLGFVGWTYLGE